MFQQNTAQEHRQNNNCGNPNRLVPSEPAGGREKNRCAAADASFNQHTVTRGDGAHATGGAATEGVEQQNTAQQGRQNNTCASPNSSGVTATGGRAESHCINQDRSRNKHTLTKGRGAHATGGSSGLVVFQQNTAQKGRQNNTCANPNNSGVTATGSRAESHCINQDRSRNKHTLTKGGGAEAAGGSSTGASSVGQQNTTQEGRQNNTCGNPNSSTVLASGGRAKGGCVNRDRSWNKHTLAKGGGAKATGGDAVGIVNQQTMAQEGRQNNTCANPNSSITEAIGGRVEGDCFNQDRSWNKHTLAKGGGAKATGGSGSGALSFVGQQNSAQEGRQNNNCGGPNVLTLTASGSRTQGRCVAVDNSKNIGSAHR
ncbi:hypothetical protein [Streptomyces sp. NPDC051776]|uniref:hypothetical protein n=1 Tax=Streptomyces sp. NPDC051776 TaxID=3155414 RepID=UPI00341F9AD8